MGGDDPGRFARIREATADAVLRRGDGLLGSVLASGEPAWVTDLRATPWPERSRPDVPELRAAVAFPVLASGEVVAVLEFLSSSTAPPDDELLDVMRHVGAQLGRVFERDVDLAAQKEVVEVERRFLSMLTHELRSPLVSIKGFVELLLERWDLLPEGQRVEFLERMARSADRLTRLGDEFLRLARHHAEGFQARVETVEVGEAVERVIAELSPGLTAVSVDAVPGTVASADVDFLEQILVNLLTNAHRYGEPPIAVTVSASERGVEVAVRDHGPGVPAEFVPHLFQRFARAERRSVGTGLGLSIARDLATAMGGSLDYAPAEGRGSLFVVHLPAVAA